MSDTTPTPSAEKPKKPRPSAGRKGRKPKPGRAAVIPVHQAIGLEHVPTAKLRTEVAAMAKVGVPHKNIADLVDMSIPTLLKHYRKELDQGAGKGIYDVSKSLRTQCTKGNVKAQMFFLQTQANWRVTNITQQQTLGADGEPVAPPEAKDPVDAMRSYLDFLGK